MNLLEDQNKFSVLKSAFWKWAARVALFLPLTLGSEFSESLDGMKKLFLAIKSSFHVLRYT